MSDATVAASITIRDLRGNSGRRRRDRAVRRAFLAAATTSVVISALIVFSLLSEAWTFVSQVEWATVWTDGWFPRRAMYDVRTLIVGSLLATAALPLAWRMTGRR